MKRKILAFFLVGVLILSLTMVSSASENPESYLIGDVNGDGKVDTADALEILKFVVKKESVFDDDEKGSYALKVSLAINCCERNEKKPDTADALQILKYVVGSPNKIVDPSILCNCSHKES